MRLLSDGYDWQALGGGGSLAPSSWNPAVSRGMEYWVSLFSGYGLVRIGGWGCTFTRSGETNSAQSSPSRVSDVDGNPGIGSSQQGQGIFTSTWSRGAQGGVLDHQGEPHGLRAEDAPLCAGCVF